MEIVEVTWMDACIEEAHINRETADSLVALERKQVGYIRKRTENELILCYGIVNNLFKGDMAYDLTMAIPLGCIKNIRELK